MTVGFSLACALIIAASQFSGEVQTTSLFISPVKQVSKTINIISETTRNEALEQEIRSEFIVEELKRVGDKVGYSYKRYDLNGDNNPEAIVRLNGSAYCGITGCATQIFFGNDYQVSLRLPFNNGMIVTNKKTHGWNDLIFLGEGYYIWKFDGKNYEYAGKVKKNETINGMLLFSPRQQDNYFDL